MKKKTQDKEKLLNELRYKNNDLQYQEGRLWELRNKSPNFRKLFEKFSEPALDQYDAQAEQIRNLKADIAKEKDKQNEYENKYQHLAGKGMGDEAMQLQQLEEYDQAEREKQKYEQARREYEDNQRKEQLKEIQRLNSFDKIHESRYSDNPKIQMLKNIIKKNKSGY
jgi:hypothetical protein